MHRYDTQVTLMTRQAKNAKVFVVSVTNSIQSTNIFCYVSKQVPSQLGNSKRIKFTIHDRHITVERPDN